MEILVLAQDKFEGVIASENSHHRNEPQSRKDAKEKYTVLGNSSFHILKSPLRLSAFAV